jgi:hypothetical protein
MPFAGDMGSLLVDLNDTRFQSIHTSQMKE